MNTLKPSRDRVSMRSAKTSVSKNRVKASCTRTTLRSRCSGGTARSTCGVAVSIPQRTSVGARRRRLSNGLSTIPA
ncbi:hypothetical protein D9M69_431480 [compost metagenome]